MSDQDFQSAVDAIAKVIDGVGVLVVVVGLVLATVAFARAVLAPDAASGQERTPYRIYRQAIGRAILLGLEFLVAADIIRTVAVDPTFESVGVLAIIVAVRTFLSFTLDVELDGRWPWQQERPAAAPAPAAGPGRPSG
ncbi:MAG TPA: DUF1622 domain-containing protein [Baekduia sp.]|nr:DUF1622 domain-containing protein [Baekduia sp.]